MPIVLKVALKDTFIAKASLNNKSITFFETHKFYKAVKTICPSTNKGGVCGRNRLLYSVIVLYGETSLPCRFSAISFSECGSSA